MSRRKTYSSELRREAAREVVEKSRPIATVASELNVTPQSLRNWVRTYREEKSTATLTENAPLSPSGRFSVLLSVSIGPDQEACCLWAEETDPCFDLPGAHGARVMVTQQGPDGAVWTTTELLAPAPAFPVAQPLPQGWIVVGRRCGRGDSNALVFATDGRLVGSGRVGDGVEDVQSTHSGEVWVSYFDEGVFGSDEIAAAGCVRWEVITTDNGCTVEPAWKLQYPPMADCYAMNVTDQAAYVCAYTDFHIITIEDGRTLLRDPVTAGSKALVTNGYQMAVVGSYDKPGSATLVTLEPDACRIVGQVAWRVPGSKPRDVRLAGRGDRLHGFTFRTDPSSPQGRYETRWWTTSLHDLWG